MIGSGLIRTLENVDTCIIHKPRMIHYHVNRSGKSGHLDNLDTFGWSQGVHNTQVPLYYSNNAVLYCICMSGMRGSKGQSVL